MCADVRPALTTDRIGSGSAFQEYTTTWTTPAGVAQSDRSGVGIPFAPNGRTFREWVACPVPDEAEWAALLDEARAFADARPS